MPGAGFVCFEGIEGSGKTTQAERLHLKLQTSGFRSALVHEPGTTPLGEHLRNYLKSERPLSKEAELLLFLAARAELVLREIKPGLEQGFIVIADRFAASSITYQGYGRKISLQVVERLNAFVTQGLQPDVTFLLDLDPSEGLRRVGQPQLRLPLEPDDDTAPGRQDVQAHRRFEDQPLNFHERVRKGYLALARRDPERWVTVDARQTKEEISEQVWHYVSDRFALCASKNVEQIQLLL